MAVVYSNETVGDKNKLRIVINGRYQTDVEHQLIGDRQAAFLMKNRATFKKSSSPRRILFFDADGMWVDYPPEAVDHMKLMFNVGAPAVEVRVEGKNVLVDFYRMLEVDLNSGFEKSIAWIDRDGKCYFPFVFVNSSNYYEFVSEGFGDSERVGEESGKKRKMEGGEKIDATRAVIMKSTSEVGSSSNVGTIGATNEGVFLWPKWPKARALSKDDREYQVVDRLFLSWLRGNNSIITTITGIHTCLKNARYYARIANFNRQIETVKKARGDANVSYVWYGASAKSVERILSDQILVPNEVKRFNPSTVGAYLTPVTASARLSALLCECDENGEKHIILCQAILGKSEQVAVPPSQLSPSSPDFDTGVDSLADPRLYVVWPADLSTHICLQAIVSFRTDYVYEDETTVGRLLPERLSRFVRDLADAKTNELMKLLNSRMNMETEEFKQKLRALLGDEIAQAFIDHICG